LQAGGRRFDPVWLHQLYCALPAFGLLERDSAIESLAKSQVLRVLVSELARIFYIVKRGLTWGFSSRNATQVSL
jgi:hypothetical protein